MSDLFDKDLDSIPPADERRPQDPRHDPYSALRNRDFRLFLVNSVAATVGNEMQAVAVGWDLVRRTGQPLSLGLVGLVQALPVMLLAVPAGHLADRLPKKWIVLAHQRRHDAAARSGWRSSRIAGGRSR